MRVITYISHIPYNPETLYRQFEETAKSMDSDMVLQAVVLKRMMSTGKRGVSANVKHLTAATRPAPHLQRAMCVRTIDMGI